MGRMEKLMTYLRRKSHIEYEMNCVEKYIQGGEYDQNLRKVWENMEDELAEIENEIQLLSNPDTKELETKKLELLDEIRGHEKAIIQLKHQVEELKKMIRVKA
jgi:uncharacterized protein YdcH (DUF465 family)